MRGALVSVAWNRTECVVDKIIGMLVRFIPNYLGSIALEK